MAGVTSAALTGSASAPAKANEAAQKNDIGAAKDDVQLAVTKANVTGNATVSISTTDFVVDGTILKDGGQLSWGEIEDNVPKMVLEETQLSLDTGTKYQMNATTKRTTETIHWDTSDHDIATISQTGEITTAASIDENTAQVDVIASATGCEDKICKLTVNKVLTASAIIPVPTNSATSAYVYYTMKGQTEPTLCRVLYNDSTHGLQIITAEPVRSVVLEKTDPKITEQGIAGKFNIAQASYNRAIISLNEYAMDFNNILDGGIVLDARCVGSLPTVGENNIFFSEKNEAKTSSGIYVTNTNYNEATMNADQVNNKGREADDNYTMNGNDRTQLTIINAERFTDFTYGNEYWLASRCMQYGDTAFKVGVVYGNGNLGDKRLWDGGTKFMPMDCYEQSSGFRPVFLINPTAKIYSGTGSSTDPYILQAGN